MVGDIVRDPVTGREFSVSWDGGKQCASLVGQDERYTRQRPYAKDQMTSGATLTIDLRRSGSIHKSSV
jgi:hypothetical protein